MSTALQIIQKFFPTVTRVADAKKNIAIEVTKRDNNSATVRNHKACAMAVACKRKLEADGVLVSVGTAYVIRGNEAIRYKLPEAVSREVISFDRKGGFAAGQYMLNAPRKGQRLGDWGGSKPKTGTGRPIVRKHQTAGIRTVLGGGGLTHEAAA